MSYTPSNCALETNVLTLLLSNHSDLPDSFHLPIGLHAVIYFHATFCVSVTAVISTSVQCTVDAVQYLIFTCIAKCKVIPKNNNKNNKLNSTWENVEVHQVLAVYRPVIEKMVVVMEEVMLAILSFLTDIPRPSSCLFEFLQCFKKIVSLRAPTLPFHIELITKQVLEYEGS